MSDVDEEAASSPPVPPPSQQPYLFNKMQENHLQITEIWNKKELRATPTFSCLFISSPHLDNTERSMSIEYLILYV